jgi:hypothetical protein
MQIAKHPTRSTPEEDELHQRKAQLAALEELLATGELERAGLETELFQFQHLYLEAVGGLISELDELEARIAEARARGRPRDESATTAAAYARMKAAESAQAYREETKASPPEKGMPPSEDLGKLFRAVAKRIHPDLAVSDEDRILREELMKRANAAYKAGDAEQLGAILKEYEARPESIEGESVQAELDRVNRKIELVQKRMRRIKEELGQLMLSELAILRQKAEIARQENRDFLAEMAHFLREKIIYAKRQLHEVEKGRAA